MTVQREVQKGDIETLVQLAINTGVFNPGEAEELLGETLVKLLNNNLPIGHQAHLLENDNIIIGYVYFGPTEDADVWNLWWIGVDPQYKGHGYGKLLLKFFETTAIKNNAKKVIIETSSLPLFERTREFYRLQGYQVSHSEANAYGEGDDKIVYFKQVE